MVHELHKLGYQRLRIAPGMSPSGMHWRCSVTHAGNIKRMHGAMMCDFDDAAHYTAEDDNQYFGWKDAKKDTARKLASKFLDLTSPPSPTWAKVRTGHMPTGTASQTQDAC